MLREEQLQRLTETFAKYPNVRAVYLFGSHAQGMATPASDLDLGVLLDEGYVPTVKLDFLQDLAEEEFCDVDLVILNDVFPLVRYEAVKHHNIVFSRPDFDHGEYFARVVGIYLDFQPFLAVQREYLKKSLLSQDDSAGGGSGYFSTAL